MHPEIRRELGGAMMMLTAVDLCECRVVSGDINQFKTKSILSGVRELTTRRHRALRTTGCHPSPSVRERQHDGRRSQGTYTTCNLPRCDDVMHRCARWLGEQPLAGTIMIHLRQRATQPSQLATLSRLWISLVKPLPWHQTTTSCTATAPLHTYGMCAVPQHPHTTSTGQPQAL